MTAKRAKDDKYCEDGTLLWTHIKGRVHVFTEEGTRPATDEERKEIQENFGFPIIHQESKSE